MRWECDVCGGGCLGPRPLHCPECGLAGTYVRADAAADGDDLREHLFSVGFHAEEHPILSESFTGSRI